MLDNELNVNTGEKVLTLHKTRMGFRITSDKGVYDARAVLFAIGAMDYSRRLNVPGEDLPVHQEDAGSIHVPILLQPLHRDPFAAVLQAPVAVLRLINFDLGILGRPQLVRFRSFPNKPSAMTSPLRT